MTLGKRLLAFLEALKIQCRIIHAILMREIITRYGRHNIGFAWMFAEPMMFTLGIVAIWSYSRELGRQHHISVASFAITGYSTILNWRNTVNRCVDSVEPNRSLLFHRNVRVIDVFWARILLELGGITLSSVMIFTAFIAMGWIDPPSDLLKMLGGWALLCWYSTAMAMLIGGLTEYSELVDKIWHPLAYFQLPLSGAFVMASWLPPELRKVVMIFPVPHTVELFRSGYYGPSVKAIYDVNYVVIICSVITLLALFVVRDISHRSDK